MHHLTGRKVNLPYVPYMLVAVETDGVEVISRDCEISRVSDYTVTVLVRVRFGNGTEGKILGYISGFAEAHPAERANWPTIQEFIRKNTNVLVEKPPPQRTKQSVQQLGLAA